MTLESLDATAPLGSGVGQAARGAELPHLDRLIQTATDEISAVGREGNTVDAVLVAIGTFKTLEQVSLMDVPNADALVERTSGDVLGVGGNGNSCNTILDSQSEGVSALLDIPETNGSISTARCNRATIAGKVERVNVLLVTGEGIANRSRLNVPNLRKKSQLSPCQNAFSVKTYSDQLVFSTGSKVLAIGTEANAANVQITSDIHSVVLEYTELLARLNVVNLSGTVAAGGYVLAVMAEAHAADNTLVCESVDKIDIQHARHVLVKDDEPVVTRFL